MQQAPTGTLTFLMTDIEGSTRLWEGFPDLMGQAIKRHEAIVHEIVSTHNGYYASEQGEGDSTLSAFNTATDAARAALDIRKALATETWPEGIKICVRSGIHSGVADLKEGTYYGRALNRTARIRALAHGGQILLSRASRELLDPKVFPVLNDHGNQRLKDLLQPEHIYELPVGEDFPPLRGLASTPNNLPLQISRFIDRQQLLAAAISRLGKTRLLTLVGPGGTGKTRLSLQIAVEEINRFRDGVFFCELVSARTQDEVAGIIAAAIGAAQAEAGTDPLPNVCQRIGQSEILLVLDNCEDVTFHAAQVASHLLHTCPRLALLATTRESLQIHGETVFKVSSMSLPNAAGHESVATLLASEAGSLLVDRVTAKAPEFKLDETNAHWLATICRGLDGIPLALELIAPRFRVLSPEEIATRLSNRLKLLVKGDSTVSERHHTMAAAIDHSYEPLSDSEKKTFRTLAVFEAGWQLSDAQFLLEDEDAHDGLESLCDKSLVQSETLPGGSVRFRMLETLREYALLKLKESPEEHATYDRLRRWCMAHAPDVVTPGIPEELRTSLLANVRTALAWLIVHPEFHAEALALCVQFKLLWVRGGHAAEGLRCFDELLRNAEPQRTALWADAYNIAGVLSWSCNRLEDAEQYLRRSLELCQGLGDLRKEAGCVNNYGLLLIKNGRMREAEDSLRRALDLFIELGDQVQAASTAGNLGRLALECGDFASAESWLMKALVNQDDSATWTSALTYGNIAQCRLAQGRHVDAASALWRALNLELSSPDTLHCAKLLRLAAWLALEAKDYSASARFVGAAERCDESGDTKDDSPTPNVMLEQVLGNEKYLEARSQGLHMSIEQSLDLAASFMQVFLDQAMGSK